MSNRITLVGTIGSFDKSNRVQLILNKKIEAWGVESNSWTSLVRHIPSTDNSIRPYYLNQSEQTPNHGVAFLNIPRYSVIGKKGWEKRLKAFHGHEVKVTANLKYYSLVSRLSHNFGKKINGIQLVIDSVDRLESNR